jgi:hypothetical protein
MLHARAEDYRQRAQECVDIARSVSLEDARTTLIDMARTWLRLAKEQDSSTPPHGESE